MTLRVVDPGLHTLVVDAGRPRSRSLGVPIGGAADGTALALGNGLVGNPPDAAALEISLSGPTLQADAELACVLYGAPFAMASDRQPLRAGKTFTLQQGESVRIGSTGRGMRAYFCVHGGLQTPIVLDSRSGLEPLRAGVELPCQLGSIRARFMLANLDEQEPGARRLRVLDGPQNSWFTDDSFCTRPKAAPVVFTVDQASNRMGLRLRGEPLPVPARELISEPVCPGSVQVTRDGQCIILGVDGQTIGGYPKIAQVISADLDMLGQLRPGETIVFVRVSLEVAQHIFHARQAKLHGWLTRLAMTR
jgi:biotin-dependent carboxylase-like uncharacterized protein